MGNRRRARGTLAPPKYEPTEADKSRGGVVSVAQELILRDLEARLRDWMRENLGRGDAVLELAATDAWAVCSAVERAVRHVDAVRREARAWERAMAAPFARRAEAYARARGFPLPNARRFAPFVLDTYLTALGLGPPFVVAVGLPWWISTANPTAPAARFDTTEKTPQRALAVTARVWGYPTEGACRKALARWRTEIGRNRSGWREHFPADFPLPSNR